MLGAIIGDLAASQWLLDKKDFYRYLVSEQAKPSEYGMEVMYLAKEITEKKSFDKSFFSRNLLAPVSQGHIFSDAIMEWYLDGFRHLPFNRVRGVLAITAGMIGWTSNSFQEIEERLSQLNEFGIVKEDSYSIHIMAQAIFELKYYSSKGKIIHSSSMYYAPLSYWDTDKMGLLSDVTRAWKCFVNSYDFTSAIHNAVKSEINPHLTSALTGMFAEAAYGCRYVLLKSKYTGIVGYRYEIQIPKSIKKYVYGYHLFESSMLEYNKILTIPHKKNNSETDVEEHSWVDCINAFEKVYIPDSIAKRIFYGYDTDEENPYGFFYEDTHYYLYGKGQVYARFDLIVKNNWNRIINFQTTGSDLDAHFAMNHALYRVFAQ